MTQEDVGVTNDFDYGRINGHNHMTSDIKPVYQKSSGRPINAIEARPFLKWAGGKRRLLKYLLARLPSDFGTYFEPFAGSGALFFELASQGLLTSAYLSDVNPSLIDTYIGICERSEEVIALLKRHKKRHGAEYYYETRALVPKNLPAAERAARMIYLNKTCYNGLYRENKSGQFNVPVGRYKNPMICDEENLRAVSIMLRRANIARRHYADAVLRVTPRDFVYFDPPYNPRSATSSFTAYDRHGFDEEDQIMLHSIFRELAEHNVYVMLSNSDTPLIRELYADFDTQRVYANRSINSKANKRGKISELIIRSY